MLNFKRLILSLLLLMTVVSLSQQSFAVSELNSAKQRNQELEVTATSDYDAAKYQNVIEQYQQLLKENPFNGHTYYNLAAAFFRSKMRGDAIAAYLEARRLMPRDPDVHANLSFALKENHSTLQAELKKPLSGKVFFWQNLFTMKELSYTCVFLFAVAGVFGVFFLFSKKIVVLRQTALGFLALSIAVAFALSISAMKEEHWGAVTSPLAKVKSGPGVDNAVVFELQEGAPFVARKQESRWYQIELSDGKIGWIAKQDSRVYNF